MQRKEKITITITLVFNGTEIGMKVNRIRSSEEFFPESLRVPLHRNMVKLKQIFIIHPPK